MRRITRFALALAAVLVLWAPSRANAQYFGGGYGFGNMGGWNSGYIAPFGGGITGVGYNYGAPGWGYGAPGWGYGAQAYPYGTGTTTTIMVPGFGASDPLRSRARLYPAIAEPSREVILAALEATDPNKARIDLHLPAADAKVYLDGKQTEQTGMDRMFVTPRLNPASRYSMAVEVVWQDQNGRSQTTRRKSFSAPARPQFLI